MIVHTVTQGTPEWLSLRAGIPTASAFDRIFTPGGKLSKPETRAKYMHELLAEKMMGHSIIKAMTMWQQRGHEMEAEAVRYYEAQRDVSTQVIGFLTNDAKTIGASPDRFVGETSLLEIKCPSEGVHVSYLLTKAVDAEYYPQVMGQLWVSGRESLDILSYHPEMPPALIRVERDEKYIAAMSAAVEEFSRVLEETALELKGRGWIA